MNLIESARKIVQNEEIRDDSIDFICDVPKALLGDPFAIAKIIYTTIKIPYSFTNLRFWDKFESFLCGVYLSDTDKSIFCAKITQNGTNNENSYRIVECINRAETKQKIQYLINASRCLLTDFINLGDYFRICNVITQTVEEDLIFLKENLFETNLPYSLEVQGLLNVGLMHQSVFDANGDQKYDFTILAEMVDRFSVSYDNVDRYPDPTSSVKKVLAPNIELNVAEIPTEEIEKMFNDIMND